MQCIQMFNVKHVNLCHAMMFIHNGSEYWMVNALLLLKSYYYFFMDFYLYLEFSFCHCMSLMQLDFLPNIMCNIIQYLLNVFLCAYVDCWYSFYFSYKIHRNSKIGQPFNGNEISKFRIWAAKKLKREKR